MTDVSHVPFDPAHAQSLRDRFAEASCRREVSNAAFTASFQSSIDKNSHLGIVEALRDALSGEQRALEAYMHYLEMSSIRACCRRVS